MLLSETLVVLMQHFKACYLLISYIQLFISLPGKIISVPCKNHGRNYTVTLTFANVFIFEGLMILVFGEYPV